MEDIKPTVYLIYVQMKKKKKRSLLTFDLDIILICEKTQSFGSDYIPDRKQINEQQLHAYRQNPRHLAYQNSKTKPFSKLLLICTTNK